MDTTPARAQRPVEDGGLGAHDPARVTYGEVLRHRASGVLKAVASWTGLHRALFYRYDYMFRPAQLALLCTLLGETDALDGPILEVGAAAGHTTVFLNKHLDDLGSSRRYICIDTFGGFTDEDISVERERGHPPSAYRHVFRNYRERYLRQTLANNGIERVEIIASDVAAVDPSVFEGASFCLIDVDLYAPVRATLTSCLARMAPGGVIVVDDCHESGPYDGALVAYLEAVERLGHEPDIRHDKLGIIRLAEGPLAGG